MYPHYQTYGGFLPHGYDHVLFNIASLQLELNIFLCDQLNSRAEKKNVPSLQLKNQFGSHLSPFCEFF